MRIHWSYLYYKNITSSQRRKEKAHDSYLEDTSYRNQSLDTINCAFLQEKAYIENKNTSFSRVIVWLVVSDSKDLKQWIAETYTTDEAAIGEQATRSSEC
jgi:hypothetical protein